MGRFLIAFAIIVAVVYSLVEVAGSPSHRVRLMPRWLWVLAIILLPPVGSALWFVLGRPTAGNPPAGGTGGLGGGVRPQGPGPAPDDDPDFLKRLDEQSWAARMEQLRRQREAGGGTPGQDEEPGGGHGSEEGQGAGPSDRG